MAHPSDPNAAIQAQLDETPVETTTSYVPTNFTIFLVTLGLVLLTTRVYTTLTSEPHLTAHPTSNSTLCQKPPRHPYWLPVLGHLPLFLFNAKGFLRLIGPLYPQGIFSLNLLGRVHHIVHAPALGRALEDAEAEGGIDAFEFAPGVLCDVFGLPTGQRARYAAAMPELRARSKRFGSGVELEGFLRRIGARLQKGAGDFVSGAGSVVDQAQWERAASAEVKVRGDVGEGEGEKVVEAGLWELLSGFVGQMVGTEVLGSDFVTNFPDAFEDIGALDGGMWGLMVGWPGWAPWPAVSRAKRARGKVLGALRAFHEAMEREAEGGVAGVEWGCTEDVSDLVRARVEIYRKHGLNARARASCDLAMIWNLNAEANPLIFWMINRIYADSKLLAKLREEIDPHVKAVQPKQEFPVPEPPRIINFDIEDVCAKCSLMRSCFRECSPLDAAPWFSRVAKQDCVLQTGDKGSQSWLLRKDEYAHAMDDMHNTDPTQFAEPMVWKADRHEGRQSQSTGEKASSDKKSTGTDEKSGLPFKECMAFTAAIVALWDIEASGGGRWKMPRGRTAGDVFAGDNTRVWIKRRTLSQES